MSSVNSNNSNALGINVSRTPSVFITATTVTRDALPNLVLGDIAYVGSTTYYQLVQGDSTVDANWAVIAAPPAAGSANILNGTSFAIPYQSAPSTTTFLAAGTGVLVAAAGAPSWSVTPSLTSVTFADTSILSTASDHVAIASVTSGTHTITALEDYVGVNFAGTVALTLNTVNKHRVTIKDESFAANSTTHAITITPSSGLIDGGANVKLTIAGQSITLICNGANWFVV